MSTYPSVRDLLGLEPAPRSGTEPASRSGTEPGADPLRWRLPLLPRVLTFAGALHGGAGLAAVVDAAERSTGRPLVWATAQYLRHAGPSGSADVEIAVELEGHHTTQARARLHVGETEVLSAFVALGRRAFPHSGTWVSPPDVPPPDECASWPTPSATGETILDHYELRHALGRVGAAIDGTPGTGRSAMWCRGPGTPRPIDAADVAVVGDMVMLALSDALGAPTTANSLDNTIRILARPVSEWILVDVHVEAAADGFGHVRARLWSDDATLIALTSQTLVLRTAGPDGRSERHGRRIVGGA